MSSDQDLKSFVAFDDELIRAKNYVTAIGVIVLLLAFFVVTAFVIRIKLGLTIETDKWGQFGDYIGGLLNPIVGIATIVILSNTLSFQTKQIQISTASLRFQLVEQEKSQKEKQYIDLIKVWREKVQAIEYVSRSGRSSLGKVAFDEMRSALNVVQPQGDNDVHEFLTSDILFSYFNLLRVIINHHAKLISLGYDDTYNLFVVSQMSSAELCITLIKGYSINEPDLIIQNFFPFDLALKLISPEYVAFLEKFNLKAQIL
jgi:hypothetical protein